MTSCCDVILLRHVTFCCEVMLPHFVLFSGFLVKSVCLCLFVIFRVLNMNIGVLNMNIGEFCSRINKTFRTIPYV